MPYLGKYPARDRAYDRAKIAPLLTSRGMGLNDRLKSPLLASASQPDVPDLPIVDAPALVPTKIT